MNETQTAAKRRSARPEVVEIDLLALLQVLKKHIWLILAVTLLFGCAGYAYTRVAITPTYRTYFSMYINNSTFTNISSITSSDITASQYLAETAADIVGSNIVKRQVAEQAGTDPAGISISTSVNASSGVVTVYVVTASLVDTYNCGTVLMEVASSEIARIVEGSSVQIIDEAYMPTSAYQPSYRKNVLMAMLLGVVLACGALILRELMDDKVKSREDVEAHFDLVNLGAIPDITITGGRGYYGGYGYGEKRKAR